MILPLNNLDDFEFNPDVTIYCENEEYWQREVNEQKYYGFEPFYNPERFPCFATHCGQIYNVDEDGNPTEHFIIHTFLYPKII